MFFDLVYHCWKSSCEMWILSLYPSHLSYHLISVIITNLSLPPPTYPAPLNPTGTCQTESFVWREKEASEGRKSPSGTRRGKKAEGGRRTKKTTRRNEASSVEARGAGEDEEGQSSGKQSDEWVSAYWVKGRQQVSYEVLVLIERVWKEVQILMITKLGW